MAKESGIGMSVSVDDAAGSPKDISNDITSINISTPRGVQDVTGLDKEGIERVLLRADGQVTLTGIFNDAADKSHSVLKTVASTSAQRTVSIGVSGQTLAMEMVFTDYALARAATGELTWTATGQLANGTKPTWS